MGRSVIGVMDKIRTISCVMLLTASSVLLGAGKPVFEGEKPFAKANRIDELQLQNLRMKGISPAKICSDGVFIRRASLDLCGTLPGYDDVKKFLSDESPGKRAELIERLLDSEEFAHYWALRWGDILRIKSEFPVNLWPNAVHAYSFWLWDSIRRNKPYDQFARELICSSGSNFRDAPVNFYRSTQDRTPDGLAKIAVLAFLCSRLETWNSFERKEIGKLFSKVSYKKTDEWKEEIVMVAPEPFEAFKANMPDGSVVEVPGDGDPREAFAGWLLGPGRKWFAQAAVNRAWFWLFGRGIVHEPDDFRLERKTGILGSVTLGMLGPLENGNLGNPPVNPLLLDYLADEFINSGYDFKALLRLIANSSTYQQSCEPAGELALAEKYFAVYKIRRLDAEIIADIIARFSGTKPKYVSVIPEPFTFVPGEYPTIALNDGSISSSLLETFGRSARDSGLLLERNNSPSYSQRLYMLNSSDIHKGVCGSVLARDVVRQFKSKPGEIVRNIYVLFLSRYPTMDEMRTVSENFRSAMSALDALSKEDGKKNGNGNEKRKAETMKKAGESLRQLIWALVNTEEFIYKH